MGPAQEQARVPPHRENSPELRSAYQNMCQNGLQKLPNGCSKDTEMADIVVDGTAAQAPAAEGSGPAVTSTAPSNDPPEAAPLAEQRPPNGQTAPVELIKPPTSKNAPVVIALLSEPQQKAISTLEGILAKFMKLDHEGWFQFPVTERQAPNYHSIIKQPMCYSMMKAKIQNLQYHSFEALSADFFLICSNATTYNQKRSRIHKQALTMLRAGKKVLADNELAGRMAISVLFPGEATDGAIHAATHAGATLTPTSALAVPGTMDTGTSADIEILEEEGVFVGEAQSMELEAGYSNYEDSDGEELEAALAELKAVDERGQQPVAPTKPKYGNGKTPPMAALVTEVPEKPPQQLSMKEPVTTEMNWCTAEPVSLETIKSVAGTAEWKTTKRSTEWRMQWLQHRMAELEHQKQRAKAALDLHRRQVENQEQPKVIQRRERVQQPEFELPGLLRHPFFAAHSMVVDAQKAGGGPATSNLHNDPSSPARAHATLSLLGRKLASLRQQLASSQPTNHAALPAAGATYARLPSAARGRGRGRGRARIPVRSYSYPARQQSLLGFGSDDGLRLGKRRRTREEYDLNDMILPSGALGYAKVEKPPAPKEINTPKVRLVAGAELKRRQVAIDAYDKALKQGDAKALEAAQKAIDALCPDEGSSDEDDDDALFAARHSKGEQDEKTLHEFCLKNGIVRKTNSCGKEGGKGTKGKGKGGKNIKGSASKQQANGNAKPAIGGPVVGNGVQQRPAAQANGGTAAPTRNPILPPKAQYANQSSLSPLASAPTLPAIIPTASPPSKPTLTAADIKQAITAANRVDLTNLPPALAAIVPDGPPPAALPKSAALAEAIAAIPPQNGKSVAANRTSAPGVQVTTATKTTGRPRGRPRKNPPKTSA